jgi:hypothetical protein
MALEQRIAQLKVSSGTSLQQVSGSQAARRIQQMGEALLAMAEPRLAQLRCWPLSELGDGSFSQHQLVEEVQEALEMLAAAEQAGLQRS